MINSSKKQVNSICAMHMFTGNRKVCAELVNHDLTKPDNSNEMRGKGGRREEPASHKTTLDAIFPHLSPVLLLLDGPVYISSYYQAWVFIVCGRCAQGLFLFVLITIT